MKTFFFRVYTQEVIKCQYNAMIEAETYEEALQQFKTNPLENSTLEKEYLIDAEEEGYFLIDDGQEQPILEIL